MLPASLASPSANRPWQALVRALAPCDARPRRGALAVNGHLLSMLLVMLPFAGLITLIE